jgi:3-oxosteroid 1-dehydrogenase
VSSRNGEGADHADPVDVVVLGGGCAGMMAALAAADEGAAVSLHEKAEVLGATVISRGVAWLPVNKYQAEHGVADSVEEGSAYLTALSNGMILPEFTEASLATVKPMLEWTEQRTPLQVRLVPATPTTTPSSRVESPAAGGPPSRACSSSSSWGSGPTGSSVPPVDVRRRDPRGRGHGLPAP